MDGRELNDLYESYLEVYQELDEAEGSYGQTPRARAAFASLADKREATPSKAFRGKKGGKTAAVGRAFRHLVRSGGYYPESGKKSPRPEDFSVRSKMTQRDRDYARQVANDIENKIDTYGPPTVRGSLPKGKKLERQRKTGVSESFDLYDIILSHLLDEGYAETPEAAEVIMVNMSEEWRDSIINY